MAPFPSNRVVPPRTVAACRPCPPDCDTVARRHRQGGTVSTARTAAPDELTIGVLVAVRGQRWVISDVEASEPNKTGDRTHLVSLQSVEDGRYGDTLDVIWEVEPGRLVLPTGALPEVAEHGFDPPARLAA